MKVTGNTLQSEYQMILMETIYQIRSTSKYIMEDKLSMPQNVGGAQQMLPLITTFTLDMLKTHIHICMCG